MMSVLSFATFGYIFIIKMIKILIIYDTKTFSVMSGVPRKQGWCAKTNLWYC